MVPGTLTQTTFIGQDFDGTAGLGLFDFSALNGLPRTSRVVLNLIAFHVDVSPIPPTPPIEYATIIFQDPDQRGQPDLTRTADIFRDADRPKLRPPAHASRWPR